MKIGLILPVLVALFLTLSGAGMVAAENTTETTGLYEQGVQTLEAGNYDEAISALTTVIEENPEDADAWFKLGGAYFLSDRPVEAFAAYENATTIDPNQGGAWAQIGNMDLFYAVPPNPTGAVDAYEKAVGIITDDAGIYINKGIAHLLANDSEQAISSFDQALSLEADSPRALYWKGVTLSDSGNMEEGLDLFVQATEVKPDYKDAWYARADTETRLGQFEEAEQSLQKTLEIEGDCAEPFNYGTANDADVWYRLGVIKFEIGDNGEEALKDFDKALELDPENHNAWYYKGVIQYTQDDREGSRTSLDEAIRLKEDFARAWYWKGRLDLGDEQLESAADNLYKATEIDPELTDAWYYLGGVLGEGKDYEGAVIAFDEVTQRSPDFADAWYFKGMNLYQSQLYQDAIDSMEQALSLTSDTFTEDLQANAYHVIGLSRVNLDDNEGASEAFAKSVEINATNAIVWNDYGAVLNDLSKFDEALSAFDKAIESDDSSAEYWLNKGNTLTNLEQFGDAVSAYDKAIEIEPAPRAYNAKGKALVKQDENEKAIEAFDAGIALDEGIADLYANKAVALMNLKRYDEAIAAIDKALELDPEWDIAITLKSTIEEAMQSEGSGTAENTSPSGEPEEPAQESEETDAVNNTSSLSESA